MSEQEVSRGIRTKRYKYTITDPKKGPRALLEPEKYPESFLQTLSPVEREEYIFSGYASSKQYQEQYLFDLEQDPTESCNLIGCPEYREIRLQLREQLIRRMQQAGEEIPQICEQEGTGKNIYE